MITVKDYWLKLIREITIERSTQAMSPGDGRKYIAGPLTLSVPGNVWNKADLGLTLEDLNYKEQKISMLKRIYVNDKAIAIAKGKLQARFDDEQDLTSVEVITRSATKDPRSQGYCMLSIVVTRIEKPRDPITGGTIPKAIRKPITNVTVFYRITEITQKFGADLILLHDHVIPAILPAGWKADNVEFVFANAYFSCMFSPLLWPFIDMVQFCRDIGKERQHELHRGLCRFLKSVPTARDPDAYAYRKRREMYLIAYRNWEGLSPEAQEDLINYLKEAGEL